MIPYSVLDLSPILEGSSARDAFRNTLDLARRAEGWGYTPSAKICNRSCTARIFF